MTSIVEHMNAIKSIESHLMSKAGLNIPDFSKRHGLTTRTVFRYLRAIKTTGREIDVRMTFPEFTKGKQTYWHAYRRATPPIFNHKEQTATKGKSPARKRRS